MAEKKEPTAAEKAAVTAAATRDHDRSTTVVDGGSASTGPTVEPVGRGENPTTTGQQLQSNAERGQASAEAAEETEADLPVEQDVQPAIAVGEDGKTRQVKQLKTR